jgi:hypothetical protein
MFVSLNEARKAVHFEREHRRMTAEGEAWCLERGFERVLGKAARIPEPVEDVAGCDWVRQVLEAVACYWRQVEMIASREQWLKDEVAAKRFCCKTCGSDLDAKSDPVLSDYKKGLAEQESLIGKYGFQRRDRET